jgi:hypothetical protein
VPDVAVKSSKADRYKRLTVCDKMFCFYRLLSGVCSRSAIWNLSRHTNYSEQFLFPLGFPHSLHYSPRLVYSFQGHQTLSPYIMWRQTNPVVDLAWTHVCSYLIIRNCVLVHVQRSRAPSVCVFSLILELLIIQVWQSLMYLIAISVSRAVSVYML